MRKLFTGFLLTALLATNAFAATTFTTNYNLAKPSDGATNWGAQLRGNLDAIDTQMFVNAGSISNHIADAVDAHDASAISAVAGSICTTSTDVQDYLDCLDAAFFVGTPIVSVFGRVGAVVAVAGDYTASLITNTPAGSIAAVDVQNAINELDTEKQFVLTNSAGLASALSDETGTGFAVFSASPALTGNPTAPTQAALDNSTKIATTAYVDSAVSAATPVLTQDHIFVGNASNVATDVPMSGDATIVASGALTIANNAVSNAKLADMATQTFKGRTTAGSGDPEDLSATQATAILNNFVGDSGAGGTKGLVPAPAAGDAAASKFLKADGTWATVVAGQTGIQFQDESGNLGTSGTVDTVDCVGGGITCSRASNTVTITVPAGSSITSNNISGNTTGAGSGQVTYFVNTSGGAVTFTLPAAASFTSTIFIVKNITIGGANNVNVARTGADTIEGDTTDVLAPGDVHAYQSNGTSWYVMD